MESSPFLILLVVVGLLSIGLFKNCGGSFASVTHATLVDSGSSLASGAGHAPTLHNQDNSVIAAAWNSADSVSSFTILERRTEPVGPFHPTHRRVS